MEVYDAFSLSPITVLARVLTSHPTSVKYHRLCGKLDCADSSAALGAVE